MDDLISRQAILQHIEKIRQNVQMIDDTHRADIIMNGIYLCEKAVRNQPSAQPEPLTDKEQRIFLAAMGREEKVCKQVDDECRDCREPYEDSLVWTCREISRKVKGALWT
jgi:hypothetical protein